MPLLPAGITLLLVLPLAVLGLTRVLPVARAGHVGVWPEGDLRYFDDTGMEGTVGAAAERWNASGARVHLTPVRSAGDADVVFTVDDPRLLDGCGRDCLGFSSTIGRPWGGHAEVLLSGDLGS